MDKLVSDILESRLQLHIKGEFDSAQIYDAMGSWCRYEGYKNVATFFFKHAVEERDHAKLVIDMIDDKNCMAIIPEVTKPDISGYKNIKSVFQIAYEHEKLVTKMYNDTALAALKEGNFDVYGFALEFLKEQREEIQVFRDYLDKLELLGDGPQAAYLFDHDFDD